MTPTPVKISLFTVSGGASRGSGATIAIVVTAIVVAMILGMSLMGGMKGEAALTARHHEAVLAQYLAEAAAAEAIAVVRKSIADGTLSANFCQTLSQSQNLALPSVEPVNSRLLLRELLTGDKFTDNGSAGLPAGFQDAQALPPVSLVIAQAKAFSDGSSGDPVEKYGTLKITARAEVGNAASTVELLRDFKVVALTQPQLPSGTQFSLFTALGIQPTFADIPNVDGDKDAEDVYKDKKYFPYLSIVEEMAQQSSGLFSSGPDEDEIADKVKEEIKNNQDWKALFEGQSPSALQYFKDTRKISYFFQDKDEFLKYFGTDKGSLAGVTLLRNQGNLDLGTLELPGKGILALDRYSSAKLDLTNSDDDLAGILYMSTAGLLTLKGQFTGFLLSAGSSVDATAGVTVKKGNALIRLIKNWDTKDGGKSKLNVKPDSSWFSGATYAVTLGEQNCSWRMEGR